MTNPNPGISYNDASGKLYNLDKRAHQLGSWRQGTYLARHGDHISIDNYSNEVIQLRRDGTVAVVFTQWERQKRQEPWPEFKCLSTYNERWIVNRYFIFNDRWCFYPYRSHTMLKRIKHPDDAKIYRGGFECSPTTIFDARGRTDTKFFGKSFEMLQELYKQIDYMRELPRRRGRHWQRRVRNLWLDRTNCAAKGKRINGCLRNRRRWDDEPTDGPREFKCGCKLVRRNIGFNYKIERILVERNSTVRTCMVKLYGVEKFFRDANAKQIDARDEYQLYRLRLGREHDETDQERAMAVLTALRMVCPSTGETHVHLVPNSCSEVDPALNWIYNVPDYEGTLKSES